MIEVNHIAAQGDVLFRRIERLPAGIVERKVGRTVVVAHSETGHHHAIHDPGVRLFEDPDGDTLIRFLVVSGAFADVVHHRPHDTHQTLRLPQGTWEVRRQRQWVPEGWRLVED